MASHLRMCEGLVAEGMSASNALSGATPSPSRGSGAEGQFPCDIDGRHMSTSDEGFVVYILRCADGAYYVGSTGDIRARLEAHNAGRGPRYTACRRPVELVLSERFDTMAQARQRETQLKKWSRAKKEALIAGEMHRLHDLSRRMTS